MSQRKTLAELGALLKKQIAALTIFALGFSLVGVISAPQASAVYNFAAQTAYADASGRVGGSIRATVHTRLAAGVTSSGDQVAVALTGYVCGTSCSNSANYSTSSFATTQTPSSIIGDYAKYNFSIPAPTLAGSYYLTYCVNASATPMTHSSVVSGSNTQTADLFCQRKMIQVGGSPATAIFANKSLSANPISGTGNAEANSQVVFFDASGYRTRLLISESFTITSTSATLNSNYGVIISNGIGTIPSTSKALIFSGFSGDADGRYRFSISDALGRSSLIKGLFENNFGTGNFSNPNTDFTFSTSPIVLGSYKQQLLEASISGTGSSFASGTDGKLYFWGGLSSYRPTTLPSWISIAVNKPMKLDFSPFEGSLNSLTVKKIIDDEYVLSSDGFIYRNFRSSNSSTIETDLRDLEPTVFPALRGVSVVDATSDINYLLDSQGRVWKKIFRNFSTVQDYELVDLSAFTNPFITKIEFSSWGAGAIFMLSASGDVYSQGENQNGLLGQNSTGAPTSVGKVALPIGVIATDLFAGRDFAYIVSSQGALWSWGSNSSNQQGKDSTLIPFSITPILGILPVGVTGSVWGLSQYQIAFISSDSKTVFAASSSSWSSQNVEQSALPEGNLLAGFSGYIWVTVGYMVIESALFLTPTGKVYVHYRYGNPNYAANCVGTNGFARSVGQFGPISTDDAIRFSGLYLENESTTVATNQTFSLKVGETITLQVVQPRTNCYNVDELAYKWDFDGSQQYRTNGNLLLSQTGYRALNATLNFSTPGRKEVRLKLSTPDGLDLILKFTVGVESKIAPIIDFGDTTTSLVSGTNNGAIGIGTDGRVFTWGYNDYGQLAVPTNTYAYRFLPMVASLPFGVKARTVLSLYSGGQSNYVIDTDGKVWGVGSTYAITGDYGSVDTFTALSNLANYGIIDIQVVQNLGKAWALTKTGQIISWQLGTNGSGRVPTQLVSTAGINVKQFAVQYDGNSGTRVNAVDVSGNLWTVSLPSDGSIGDAIRVSTFTDIQQLSWNGTQATLVTGSGTVWYSVNGSSPFAQVSLPAGVTAVDAMYSGSMYLLDSTKKIWTAGASQSGNTVTMGTWTAYAAQANGQAGPNDQPIFQHRGSNFISFASGNLLYTGSYSAYQAGRCNVYNGSNSGNRVYSSGQFGAANIIDQINTSASVAIASQNSTNFTNGQFFSANPGDAVVIRLVNPTSGCFNGSSQLTAVADTSGTGSYNTAVPLSNEGGGNYSFTLSASAPTSGRKSIGIRISTPLGTSSIFSLGLGVFGTETITAIVPRTNPVNTSQAAVFAVASDGFAYGWSTPTDVSYDYNGTTVSFMNMITSTPPRNSGSPTKLELPGGVRVREAVPFTSCCTNNYGRYIFGVLAADEYGRTWTWGSDSNLRAANGYAYQSTPLTPTQIPALVGENVVRLSVSSDGRRALALTSKGIVYQWFYSSSVAPTRVASLAGLNITDIQANNYISYAITETGQLYAFNGPGYLAGISATGNAIYDALTSATQVNIFETVTAIMPLADPELTAAKTSSGNVYLWGELYSSYNGNNLQMLTPTRVNLPNSRTASLAGTVNYSSYSSNVVTASDGTWWDIALNAQGQLTYFQRSGVASEVRSNVRTFASGAGQAMVLNSGAIYTTSYQIAGTCGPISTYTRVMSTGQFGPLYKADQIYINVNGNEITRPNTSTSVSVTGWSACDGGANITMTADYIGNNVYGDTRTATVSQDGSRATSTFTFTKTQNGPVYMHFKTTTAAGLSGTETFFTKVVPAPLPGRQIGISINSGDRYTNSSNVNLSLVWPDGTTKIYVSNDGGFAPGTVSDYDLQYTVPWVLPPQAVIPLPSIVYARFDNDPNTYYFDDIILDAITPVLTYASAR
jgi:alpha-tubulin suppressor-like RCC1 family protein